MKHDFDIERGIDLVKGDLTLDLHNFYDTESLVYDIAARSVKLTWRRASRPEVPGGMPLSVTIRFDDVTMFAVRPRDPDQPFTEDACMDTFGNWNEAHGVVSYGDAVVDWAEPLAIGWRSGAVLVITAGSARSSVGPLGHAAARDE